MKCQVLFSLKKIKKNKMLSAKLLLSALRVIQLCMEDDNDSLVFYVPFNII